MNATEVLERLGSLGGELITKPDGKLAVRAPRGSMTPEFLQQIESQKQELQQIATACSKSAAAELNSAEKPDTPAQGVHVAELETYFTDMLAAHPAAESVTRRSALAEYLAKGILERYGDLKAVSWCSGQPVSHRNRSHMPWTARCPAGHLTDEALWTNQAIGWACKQCQQIYDWRECSLVPRP